MQYPTTSPRHNTTAGSSGDDSDLSSGRKTPYSGMVMGYPSSPPSSSSSPSGGGSPRKLSDYRVLESIGTGSFGIVKKIERISDGKILVWKEINYGRMTEKEKEMLVSEVNILRELRHPHIVRYYDRILDKERTRIYIVMEYCERGDLASLIKQCRRNKQCIHESYIWKCMAQMLLALNECHNRPNGKILHRDIKPANVFMDREGNCKLGDFGLARIMTPSSDFAQSYVGTPFYMSPEQTSESAYNEKSDIWSLGCVLYELITLSPPFEASNHKHLASLIRIGRVKPLPPNYSEELNNIVRMMLAKNTAVRPSIEDLLLNPHVRQYVRVIESTYKENSLRRREETVTRREERVRSREAELEAMKKDLETRERNLKNGEERLRRMNALADVSGKLNTKHYRSNNQQHTSHLDFGCDENGGRHRQHRPNQPRRTVSSPFSYRGGYGAVDVSSDAMNDTSAYIDQHSRKENMRPAMNTPLKNFVGHQLMDVSSCLA